jgi:hypothetical protein
MMLNIDSSQSLRKDYYSPSRSFTLFTNMKTSQAFTLLAVIISTVCASATPSFGTNSIEIVDHGNNFFGEPVRRLFTLSTI